MRQDLVAAWNAAPEFKDIRYPGQGPSIEKVAEVLDAGEEVVCVIKCMHVEKKGMRAVTLKCVGVVTSKKIYMVKEGTFTKGLSAGAESVPLQTVTGISRKRQLGLGTVIEVSRANNTDQLVMCNEDHAAKWVEAAKASTEAVASGCLLYTSDAADE